MIRVSLIASKSTSCSSVAALATFGGGVVPTTRIPPPPSSSSGCCGRVLLHHHRQQQLQLQQPVSSRWKSSSAAAVQYEEHDTHGEDNNLPSQAPGEDDDGNSRPSVANWRRRAKNVSYNSNISSGGNNSNRENYRRNSTGQQRQQRRHDERGGRQQPHRRLQRHGGRVTAGFGGTRFTPPGAAAGAAPKSASAVSPAPLSPPPVEGGGQSDSFARLRAVFLRSAERDRERRERAQEASRRRSEDQVQTGRRGWAQDRRRRPQGDDRHDQDDDRRGVGRGMSYADEFRRVSRESSSRWRSPPPRGGDAVEEFFRGRSAAPSRPQRRQKEEVEENYQLSWLGEDDELRHRSRRGMSPPSWEDDVSASDLPAWRRPRWEKAGGGSGRKKNSPGAAGSASEATAVAGEDGSSRQARQKRRHTQNRTTAQTVPRTIVLPRHHPTVSLSALSSLTRTSIDSLVKLLRDLGEWDNVDAGDGDASSKQSRRDAEIDVDLAELLALELGLVVERTEDLSLSTTAALAAPVEEEGAGEVEFEEGRFEPRAPVVCVMGHVDHGKTTLLDALRNFGATGDATAPASGRKKQGKGNKKGKRARRAAADGGGTVEAVAGTEAGGITQMISAFQVGLGLGGGASSPASDDDGEPAGETSLPSSVTFLDTPGHAAFARMRHSGLFATDVVVLVVAATDGLKEQTREILDLYQSATTSGGNGNGNVNGNDDLKLVVAVTKIDRPGVDADEAVARIENELISGYGIETEGVGGTVPIVPVSGITGEGLEDLVEVLRSVHHRDGAAGEDGAEAAGGGGLTWDTFAREGTAVVLDARMEKGVGVVAECVVRSGRFRRGDFVVAGRQQGKIRLLKDVGNKSVATAEPSQPVRIVGLKSPPAAGESIICVDSEERAEDIVSKREALHRATSSGGSSGHIIEADAAGARPERRSDPLADLQIINSKTSARRDKVLRRFGLSDGDDDSSPAAAGGDDEAIHIPIIIKTDADGTLHAVESALVGLASESAHPLVVDPILCEVGPITPSDVTLASESGATIFAFNVGADGAATSSMADGHGVSMRRSDVIYSLVDDARDAFADYLPTSTVDTVHGSAVVQTVFRLNNNRSVVAGCKVSDGSLFLDRCSASGSSVRYRVLRDGSVIAGGDGDASTARQGGLRASSLRKFKEDVAQIRGRGEECGLGLDGFDDYEAGDVIECYSTEETKAFV